MNLNTEMTGNMEKDKFEELYSGLLKKMDIYTCQLNASYVSLGCSVHVGHLDDVVRKVDHIKDVAANLADVQNNLMELDKQRFNYGSV